MKIACETLTGGIELITLEGRMDIPGCQEIDLKLPAMAAAPKKYVIVDISEVSFLASIGIRLLLLTAKSVSGRGGKLVLLNPTPNVAKVLEAASLTTLLASAHSLEEAIAFLTVNTE